MSELDQLRDLVSHVRPPAFHALVSTARRRNRRAAATGATAAIVMVGAGALPIWDADRSAPGPAGADETSFVAAPVIEAVVTQEIRVGRDPSDLAVHPKTGDVYVTGGEDDTVSVIDTTAHRVTDTIAVGHEPSDIAIDPTTGLVYVSNGGGAEDADEDQWTGSVSVINARTRRTVDTIVIGQRKWPSGLAVDPTTHSLFVTNNGDATVSVIDTDTHEVVKTLQVGQSPHSIAVNPAANEAYVPVNGYVSVIDTRAREIANTIRVSGGDIAVDPSTGLLFMANEGDGIVTVVDASTRELVKAIRVGGRGPFTVELDAEAARAYITGAQDGTIAVLDTQTLRIVERIAPPTSALGLFQNPVVHAATDSVYLIVSPRDIGVIARR